MAKQQIKHSELSTKELELLKDIFIDLKVKSMNINDLKEFAIENISLQIKNTIGDDEELEAWQEMAEFFQDEFDNIIKDVQSKLRSNKSEQANVDIDVQRIDSESNEDKRKDMW